jgi:hypothetical protein
MDEQRRLILNNFTRQAVPFSEMFSKELELELVTVIGMFAEQLGEGEADDFQDIARHNECQVALEMFCSQLAELSVPLTTASFERIRGLVARLRLHPNYLESISKLVVAGPDEARNSS